jgi:hypothetical protein
MDGGDPRRGSVLAGHLYSAYTALIRHVEKRIEDYSTLPDEESRGGAVTEMRQLVAGARNLHRSLSWLDAARDPPLDLGTRYLVDQAAAHLVSANAEVTVVAAIDRSYATVTNPLQPVFELSDDKPSDDGMAIVVFVPRREQHSGLLHPLIIHELAHAANAQYGLVDNVLKAAAENADLLAAMGDAAMEHARDGMGKATLSADELSAASEIISDRLSAWVEEAVCDTFAAQLLGPTYLYSFMAIVGTSDLDAAGEEHPPTRQRIRLILNQLDDHGWKPLLASSSKSIDKWFREQAQKPIEYGDVVSRFCVTALNSLEKEIRQEVAAHTGEFAFLAKDFKPLGKEIADLLGAGVPPAQTLRRKPIKRAAIILGSWLFAVKEKGGDLDALATAADVPELSSLLPKALQDAALLEAWGER